MIPSSPGQDLAATIGRQPRTTQLPRLPEVLQAPTPADIESVAAVLGREPRGNWQVAARGSDGHPTVILNEPFMPDGTPMPTRHWLVDADVNRRIGTLEASGGVNEVEAELGLDRIAAIHAEAAVERNTQIAADHEGPRPSGGVGGTRVGVKCLHAHYARYLAGHVDDVGEWVHSRLGSSARSGGSEQLYGAGRDDD